MGRAPCCEKEGLKKGPWTPEEDQKLIAYIQRHGHGSWRALPKNAGLLRCGKSCRLRWTNYLRPDIKRGRFSIEEEQMIIQLHAVLGNRWSAIASHLPGRTDNEIKNYWNTHLKKRLMHMGIDPVTHRARCDILDALEARPFLSSALSHMMQWENARLEAEARLASEYYRLAKTRQSILDAGASFMDLDTIRRRLVSQGLALNNNSSSCSDIDALKFLPDWDPSVDDSGVLKEMQQISFCVGDQEGSIVTEGHSSSSYSGTTPQSEGLLDDHQSIFQTDKFNFEGTCPQNSDMTHFMDEDALFQHHQNLLKLEIDPIPGLSSCSPPSLISQPDCFTFSEEQLLEQDHLPMFDSEQDKKDSVSHLDLAVWSDQEAVQSKDYWSSLLKIVGSTPSL